MIEKTTKHIAEEYYQYDLESVVYEGRTYSKKINQTYRAVLELDLSSGILERSDWKPYAPDDQYYCLETTKVDQMLKEDYILGPAAEILCGVCCGPSFNISYGNYECFATCCACKITFSVYSG